MRTSIFNPRRMGAIPREGGTSFRVWAPHASSVSVVGEFNNWSAEAHPMRQEDGGNWFCEIDGAHAGEQYQFEIANGDQRFRKNDAYARVIHGKSAFSVIYEDSYEWKTRSFQIANWNELVIYELHVGTFAAAPDGGLGKFEQIIQRLPYLKELGVNALEIMPLMAFPGERSWGYNLTNPFAVEAAYGGPDGLKRLVDEAHAHGIAIVLDVVYNHFGPDHLDLWRYDGWSENDKGGIYFYNDQRSWTPWGENRPNYGCGEVRQYIRDNVLLWLEEFRVDGLRFDSTAYMRNCRGENNNIETDIPEAWSLFQWINEEIERHFPGRITIAEDLQQNPWLTKKVSEGGAGFSTQWDSGFVHAVRANLITPADEARSPEAISRAITSRFNEDYIQRVIYSESHDEDANGKARIPQEIDPKNPTSYYVRKRSILGAGLVLTTPGIPMLFEGQEFLEDGWFRDDKTLDWSKERKFEGITHLYRDLIYLRRNLYGNTKGLSGPFVRILREHNEDKLIVFHRWAEGGPKDDVVVIASFNHQALDQEYRIGLPKAGAWIVRVNSDWKGYSPDFHDVTNPEGRVIAEKPPQDNCDYSGVVNVPSYGFLVLSQEEAAPEPEESKNDVSSHK